MEKIEMPLNVRNIINKLERNGHSAYIVGGCVRDSLLGRKPNDWDICTSATPHDILKIFRNRKTLDVGINHGTITVVIEKEQYEITTYRIDGEYSDSRRPKEVIFTNRLVEDLKRRDFTMNAIAYNDTDGLVDPFNGVNDIKNKIIKCVGEPSKRFEEDALRIMRLYRFSSQLGFNIEENTNIQANKLLSNLDNISNERIQYELCKIITGKYFFDVLKNNSKLICKVIPEIEKCVGFEQNNKYHIYDVYEHTLVAMRESVDDKLVRLALLLHDIGKPKVSLLGEDGFNHYKGHEKISAEIAKDILDRLKFDNITKDIVLDLIKNHDRSIECTTKSIKRILNKLGEHKTRLLLEVRLGDIKAHNPELNSNAIDSNKKQREILEEIMREYQCFSLKDLDINGRDLIKLGYKGKEIGKVLNKLLELVINEEVENNKDKLIRKLKEI